MIRLGTGLGQTDYFKKLLRPLTRLPEASTIGSCPFFEECNLAKATSVVVPAGAVITSLGTAANSVA